MAAFPSASSTQQPTGLPERYEIRRLGPEHKDWAKAIVCHANVFHSPVWAVCYPHDQTTRCLKAFNAADYLVEHQIMSGMSFGVFDKQYNFERPESESTNGAVYWSDLDATSQLDGQQLLERMDFPLVSIALAYDQYSPLDLQRLGPLVETLPLYGTLMHAMAEKDTRDDSWKATGLNQILIRNATATKADYGGEKTMKQLAQFLMREAKGQGYRGIDIGCMHDAVRRVWLYPPPPFKGILVCEVDVAKYEEQRSDGTPYLPFVPSKQVCSKVHVEL